MADLNKPYKITEKVNGILEKKLSIVEPKFVQQVTEWITKFQTSSGNIVRTKSNRDRMASFKTAMERYLERAGYYDMISQFLTGFDAMAEAQKEIQNDLNAISLTQSFLNQFKRVAIKQVVDNMTKQGLMNALINPIRNELNIAVNQGSSLTDVVTSIRGQLSTNEKRQGILKKLSLQSTRDALGQYDGTVNEAVRKTYKLDALLYVGSLVKDSRPQCERWTQYEENGKRGLILFEQLEDEILWADANGTGMIPNTTPENFCQNRGGYNCRHVAYPVRNPNKITKAGNVSEKVDPEISKAEQQEAIQQLKVDSFVPAKTIQEAEERLQELTLSKNKVNLKDTELLIANSILDILNEYALKNVKFYSIKRDKSLESLYGIKNNEFFIGNQATEKITYKSIVRQRSKGIWYNAAVRLSVEKNPKIENIIYDTLKYSAEHEVNHLQHFTLIAASKGGYGDEFTKEAKQWQKEWNNYTNKIQRKENEWSPSNYVKIFWDENSINREWFAETFLYYKYNKDLIKDKKILNLVERFDKIINKLNKV
jgi:hypothetical protein